MREPESSWWENLIVYGALALIITILAGAAIGARLVWAHYTYDDWSCAFAHCVKVKENHERE